MKHVLFMILLCFFPCWGFQLYERLKEAQPGDYAVFMQNKNISFLYVTDASEESLSWEEIVLPGNTPLPSDWQAWYTQQAPGNTSWFRFTMQRETGSVESLYNIKENKYFTLHSDQTMLSQVFFVMLQPVPEQHRKKIGSQRIVWEPSLMINGNPSRCTSTVWKTVWPHDRSVLGGKQVELYLIDPNPHYPSYFPIWIEISNQIRVTLRVIALGRFS